MDRSGYITALRLNGEWMIRSSQGALHEDVPTCPDWSMADLIWHTGMVHARWRAISEGLVPDKNSFADLQRPDADALVAWFDRGLAALADTLEEADPSAPAWTWSNDHTIGFIQRRMAQETAVHAWDAALAIDQPQAIDTELAVDGIDELLDVFLPRRPERMEGPPSSIHLHCMDSPGEWVVRTGEGTVVVERTHAKADAAIRANASDLLLLLWHRISVDGLEIHGNQAAVDQFLECTASI
ncbi:MAG: maleylpyruvate isomerase family mycothiol-dependent enzyme [Acidimicrobiales bacterium]